jgi:hypothetical protein
VVAYASSFHRATLQQSCSLSRKSRLSRRSMKGSQNLPTRWRSGKSGSKGSRMSRSSRGRHEVRRCCVELRRFGSWQPFLLHRRVLHQRPQWVQVHHSYTNVSALEREGVKGPALRLCSCMVLRIRVDRWKEAVGSICTVWRWRGCVPVVVCLCTLRFRLRVRCAGVWCRSRWQRRVWHGHATGTLCFLLHRTIAAEGGGVQLRRGRGARPRVAELGSSVVMHVVEADGAKLMPLLVVDGHRHFVYRR